MTFKTATSHLAAPIFVFCLFSCSVKAPPEPVKPTNDDLVEQSSALAGLTNEDLILLLLDEATRVDRAVLLATTKLPQQPTTIGCLTFTPSSDRAQLLMKVNCTGLEERRDSEKIARTMQGQGIFRPNARPVFFGAAEEIRRFRPNAPTKTLRTARLTHSVRIIGDLGAPTGEDAVDPSVTALASPSRQLEAFSRSQYEGRKAKQVAHAESWVALVTSKWQQPLGAPVTMAAGAELSLDFKSENGSSSKLTLVPLASVAFAEADNNDCQRPIGTFNVRLTTKKSVADAEVTVLDNKRITTTTEGFTFAGSTSVIPWPMSCLENVSP